MEPTPVQAPTQQIPQPQPPPVQSSNKGRPIFKIFLAVILVVLLIAAGAASYLYFTKPEGPQEAVTPAAPITASCGEVTAYDLNWEPLSLTALSNLVPGQVVYFAVGGSASSGTFDMARFTINGSPTSETSAQKPDSADFYIEYTIPEDTNSFNVSAEIHHDLLGWF